MLEDLYRQLGEDRRAVDLKDEPDAEPDATEFVYRRGWSSMAVPGLPDRLQVGEVEIHRTVGPVRTQRTLIRQRHGLPVIFDKSQQLNIEVAANQVLTVFQIRGTFADLVPGTYAFYCFVSDKEGGPPHIVEGMLSEVEVTELDRCERRRP